jgi:hypothetical protein
LLEESGYAVDPLSRSATPDPAPSGFTVAGYRPRTESSTLVLARWPTPLTEWAVERHIGDRVWALGSNGEVVPARVAGSHRSPPTEDTCRELPEDEILEVVLRADEGSLPAIVGLHFGETPPRSWANPPPKSDRAQAERLVANLLSERGWEGSPPQWTSWGVRHWVSSWRPTGPVDEFEQRPFEVLTIHIAAGQLTSEVKEEHALSEPRGLAAAWDVDGDGVPEVYEHPAECRVW